MITRFCFKNNLYIKLMEKTSIIQNYNISLNIGINLNILIYDF